MNETADWVTRKEFEDFRREVHRDAKDTRAEMNNNFAAVFRKIDETNRSRSITVPVIGGIVAMIISVWSVVERPLSTRIEFVEDRLNAFESVQSNGISAGAGMAVRIGAMETGLVRLENRMDEMRVVEWRMHSGR